MKITNYNAHIYMCYVRNYIIHYLYVHMYVYVLYVYCIFLCPYHKFLFLSVICYVYTIRYGKILEYLQKLTQKKLMLISMISGIVVTLLIVILSLSYW